MEMIVDGVQRVKVDGLEQPDLFTIMWRYYFSQFNNAGEASKMANAYIKALKPEYEGRWF